MKLGAYILVAILAMGVSTLRFLLMRKQFEQTVGNVKQARVTEKRREEVDMLLCAMLPSSALDRMLEGERISDWSPSASVLFSDMAGFTAWSSTRTAASVATMLNTLCVQFDSVAAEMGVEKVKTIGDAYWAVVGLPEENLDHAIVMVRFAFIMHAVVERETRGVADWADVRLRIGVNSGPVSAAVFGTTRLTYEVFGQTCDIAALCEQSGVPLRVCIGPETAHLLPESVETEPHVTVNPPPSTMTPAHMRHYADDEELSLRLVKPSAFMQDHIAQMLGNAADPTADNTGTGTDTASQRSGLSRVESASQGQGTGRRPPRSARRNADGVTPPNSVLSPAGSALSAVASRKSNHNRAEQHARQKRQREQFMQQRASRRDALAAQEETLEELEDRFSRRAHNWCLFGFADADVEKQFQQYVLGVGYPLRRYTRAWVAIFVLYQIAIAGGQAAEYPWYCALMMSVSALICIGLAAATVAEPEACVVPAKLDPVLLIAAWFLDVVGCALIPNSLVGNNPAYIYVVFALVLSFGTTSLPSFVIFLANLTVAQVCMVFTWSSLSFTSDAQFLILCSVLGGIAAVIAEKLYRKAFLEQRVREYNVAEQQRREQEQRVLLESIVPTHVIPALQQWMLTGMRLKDTVRQAYPLAAVGFIKLLPPPSSSPSAFASSTRKLLAVTPGATDVVGTVVEEGGDSPPASPASPVSDASTLWVYEAHLTVDRVLAYFPSFDKIKTIGDCVMIAGDFRPPPAEADAANGTGAVALQARPPTAGAIDRAAHDMLCAVAFMLHPPASAPWDPLSLKAGFNTGDVLGTVQGTSRLAFDVFGDCVNVASRTCSTLTTGRYVGVTDAFYAAFKNGHQGALAQRDGVTFAAAPEFTDVIGREAKGKGVIEVREVTGGLDIDPSSLKVAPKLGDSYH